MDIDKLRKLAAEEELSLNYIAKDEMLSKALYSLQGFDDIILKEGTAINRVYLKNKRFSEDIDFDLISEGNAKKAIGRTKEIITKLEGFEISRARIMHEAIRYDLYYTNPLNHKDRIMLEFKVVPKASGYSKKVVNFGFVPHEAAMLNVYDIEKILKQKINCVLERLEGKDFFDLYYLMDIPHKRIKIAKEKIIKKISLEEKELKSVANVTNHYIPRNSRPAWGMFLEELKEKVKKY